jgi:hypothetical protein
MLLKGPYDPPSCEVGSTLHDLSLGDVVVVGKREGWPLTVEPPRPGPNPFGEIPILTGALVKAVCEESIEAVAEHWKVTPRLVRRWREALTGRTKNVNTALALLRHDPNFSKQWY